MPKVLTSLIASFLLAQTVNGALVDLERDHVWRSYQDFTNRQYVNKFRELNSKRFIQTDIDVYRQGRQWNFSMIWRKNKERRRWSSFRNMPLATFQKTQKEYRARGHRLTDIESYKVGAKQLFAGIFVENRERISWVSHQNQTYEKFVELDKRLNQQGLHLVDFEAYQTADGVRFAGVWNKRENKSSSVFRFQLSKSQFSALHRKRSRLGYVLVEIEKYRVNKTTLYAGIWARNRELKGTASVDMTALQFANQLRRNTDLGYRLVDFEHDGSEGYSGVWIENDARFRFPNRGLVDGVIRRYRKANSISGISVAVIKDGEMVYRRGFGLADKEAGKIAHGATVYNSASISKAIGGTLAVKLAEQGKLDLRSPTNSLLKNITLADGRLVSAKPRHRYPLRNLFAHVACIQHYDGPEPVARHYKWAADALIQIWDAPSFKPCIPGRTYNYSTHAFTYIAAAMEKSTGKRVAELLENEIADPHELDSMRATFKNERMVPDYDRSRAYDDSGNPISIKNNSWKILGGGIESSPVDLARFGWKVFNGEIVTPESRDNILFKRFNYVSEHGIGWYVYDTYLEHGGIYRGVRTNLRIYKRDKLVIAVMANKEHHRKTWNNINTITMWIRHAALS